MKTSEIILLIIYILIFIEAFIVLFRIFRRTQLNHLPRFDYPFEEVYFEVTNIKGIMFNVVEYTVVVSFFRKPNAKDFVYNKYKFYDKKDKYTIGDKLYLTKKQ